MNTILIIIGLVAIAAGVVIYFVKAGKIADRDGDLIPDVCLLYTSDAADE